MTAPSKTDGAMARIAGDFAPPPMRMTLSTSTHCASICSRHHTSEPSSPSTAARATDGAVKFSVVIPVSERAKPRKIVVESGEQRQAIDA